MNDSIQFFNTIWSDFHSHVICRVLSVILPFIESICSLEGASFNPPPSRSISILAGAARLDA